MAAENEINHFAAVFKVCLPVVHRMQRVEGILKAVRSSAANAEDVAKAQAAVTRLQAQLSDLQRAESELRQQVRLCICR